MCFCYVIIIFAILFYCVFVILFVKPQAEKWTRVNFTPVMATTYNLANLIEDKTYEFRVLAVNDAGEGKPSAVSSKVVVKDPKGLKLQRKSSDNLIIFIYGFCFVVPVCNL